MKDEHPGTAHGRWTEFRFGVVGSLLVAHPARGELEPALQSVGLGTRRDGARHGYEIPNVRPWRCSHVPYWK